MDRPAELDDEHGWLAEAFGEHPPLDEFAVDALHRANQKRLSPADLEQVKARRLAAADELMAYMGHNYMPPAVQ